MFFYLILMAANFCFARCKFCKCGLFWESSSPKSPPSSRYNISSNLHIATFSKKRYFLRKKDCELSLHSVPSYDAQNRQLHFTKKGAVQLWRPFGKWWCFTLPGGFDTLPNFDSQPIPLPAMLPSFGTNFKHHQHSSIDSMLSILLSDNKILDNHSTLGQYFRWEVYPEEKRLLGSTAIFYNPNAKMLKVPVTAITP